MIIALCILAWIIPSAAVVWVEAKEEWKSKSAGDGFALNDVFLGLFIILLGWLAVVLWLKDYGGDIIVIRKKTQGPSSS